MLVLLLYSIVCDAITFEDIYMLTQKDVKEAMNKSITNVILKNITIIGENAFKNCEYMKSISIPSSVESIGAIAFGCCSKLESVSFGNKSNLTNIEYFAFGDCKELKSISIPSSVKSIEVAAFSNCSKLKSVSFGNKSNLTEIGDYAFKGCIELKSISVPSSVKSIGERAFSNCSKLESVSFGNKSKLTTIGNHCFSRCFYLRSIELPLRLKEISPGLFEECSKLKSITISSDVSKIGNYSFLNCYNLDSVRYLGTIEPNVSQNAFQGCTKLKYVYTTSKYPSKTFGPFEARKNNESNRNKIPLIALCCAIFIIVWIIILFTVLGKKKNSMNEKSQGFQAIES